MEYVWSGRLRIQSDTILYPIRYLMEKFFDETRVHYLYREPISDMATIRQENLWGLS